MGKNQHVTHRPDGQWQVKSENTDRASVITKTQKEAIVAGKVIAKKEKSELLIHGKDGKIREKNSYGNDPRGKG